MPLGFAGVYSGVWKGALMASIVTRVLECGMPLIVESMSGVRSLGVTWLLPAGSATDPDERQGMSTMWEELLMRGAGALDSRAQADAMDRLGIGRSSDTTTQHMRVGFTLLGSRLIEGLGLMTDMVLRPRMEEDAVEATRDLALQSLEALKDDPHERAALKARELHNPSPLNRSGLGTREGLEAITRQELVDGWARRARPVGSILAVAGDVESAGGADKIARELDRLFKGWSGAAERVAAGEAPRKGAYEHVSDPSAQVQIVLLHDGPAETSADAKLERVVATVLSGGMASRLFTEVREKRGLCYSVSASYATDRDYGRVMGYVGTTPERAQESLEVMLAELERINTPEGKITQEEFERAMIGMKANLIFSGESTGARAAALAGDQYRLGRARGLDEIVADYERVKLSDVNGYLARRKLGKMTIVTLGAKGLERSGS